MLACRVGRGIQTAQLKTWRSFVPFQYSSCRPSTSGVINHIDHIRLESENDARTLINHLKPHEREFLRKSLRENADETNGKDEDGQISYLEAKQLFIFNTLPFVGFGILGEYIDQSLGVLLSISTMAAAALGNIISDVAGVGLAHYIEFFVNRLGVKHPVLTAAQMESSKARLTVNLARAVGLTVGCFLGMFPLLFF